MFIKLKKKNAQSTLEYAVLAVVVIAALLSVEKYLKRGVEGKIKDSADRISAEQYDSKTTNYVKVTNTFANTEDNTMAAGSTTRMLDDEQTNTVMTSNTNTL